jgi:hypothetical protein
MMKSVLVSASLFLYLWAYAQEAYTPADPEYYAMDRENMRFDDYQTILVNYRGFVSPRQYSTTQFTNVQFLPVSAEEYNFNMNFYDRGTGRLIEDDVPTMWKSWIDDREEFDPLGSNFRPGSPSIMVTQDEKWQPNAYFRSATFHKEYDGKWVSFSVKSRTSVSFNDDEVFIELHIRNRNTEDLDLILIPNHDAEKLVYHYKEGSADADLLDPFTLGSELASVRVSSDIKHVGEKGFELTIGPGESATHCFAVKFYETGLTPPQIYQEDIRVRMGMADQVTRDKLAWAYNALPVLSSENKQFEQYYYRCILSVLMSRYENPNYISDVFWAVGTWPFTISWDNSYASDLIAMLDPVSLRKAILIDFEHVRMKRTYVSWKGAFWDNLYIQEPFALQIMIEAYLRHTGDYGIFDETAAGKSAWEWMQEWVKELQTNYTNSMGLIDVGYNTEKIIEIRTDGYNHAVPIVNTLTINLLYRMAEWAIHLGDVNAKKYRCDAEKLEELVRVKLWDDELRWFKNLYPDGTTGTIWTYHLLDMLGAEYLPDYQIIGLVSHIREGEFLGKYGLYSIARRDSVHWDLIDSDWGGGGQYAGMPGRIAKYLYQRGFPGTGWDILKRHMRYIDHFPYLPQNPRTDSPEQDRSSMPLQIAAGAGMEAIVFGTFGLRFEKEQLVIQPSINEDIGVTTLSNIKFKGSEYAVKMDQKFYTVYRDGKRMIQNYYGEKAIIHNNHED